MIRFFSEQDEMLADLRAEPERFCETGNKVLVFVHTTGRGRASDAPRTTSTFSCDIAHAQYLPTR